MSFFTTHAQQLNHSKNALSRSAKGIDHRKKRKVDIILKKIKTLIKIGP